MRAIVGVAFCNRMAVVAYPVRFAAKGMRDILFGTGIYIRNTGVTPDARIGLRLAGCELVMRVERPVVFPRMTPETKLQWVRYLSPAQQIPLGSGGRPAGLALPGNIMAGGTGEHSIIKGELARNPVRHHFTRYQIHRVSLGSSVQSIVAGPAQL